jgi:chromosome segregation ATPase
MTNALAKIKTLQAELVGLKTQIHRANSPVYDKIFALAELKGMIKELKKVPTDEGKQTERYGSVQSIKEVELNVTDIDNSISILETQIEELQNELDVHNATTNI